MKRHLKRAREALEYLVFFVLTPRALISRTSAEARRLGTRYGGHFVCLSPPERIPAVTYSFGVGDDISFETALLHSTASEVHAFDPTPGAVRYMDKRTLPNGLTFHALGIGDQDGLERFVPPRTAGHVSYSVVDPESDQGDTAIELPVKTLESIRASLMHDSIDLLKLDIEGMEYRVVDQVNWSGSSIDQIIVEFHHFMAGYSWAMTWAALHRLFDAGFTIVKVADMGREMTLLRTNSKRRP